MHLGNGMPIDMDINIVDENGHVRYLLAATIESGYDPFSRMNDKRLFTCQLSLEAQPLFLFNLTIHRLCFFGVENIK
jgi:hypothetical protein